MPKTRSFVCHVCNNKFSRGVNKASYCSRKCYEQKRLSHARRTLNCLHCGNEFERNGRGKFCSKICANYDRRRSIEKCLKTKICKNEKCKAEFKQHVLTQEYCTTLCQASNKRDRAKWREVQRGKPKDPKRVAGVLWGGMNKRTRTYSSYLSKGIEIRMTREEFISWAVPKLEIFLQTDQSPSVDRIDPKGHYELSNIRIINYQRNVFRNFLSLAYKKGGIEEVRWAIRDFCINENVNSKDLFNVPDHNIHQDIR